MNNRSKMIKQQQQQMLKMARQNAMVQQVAQAGEQNKQLHLEREEKIRQEMNLAEQIKNSFNSN